VLRVYVEMLMLLRSENIAMLLNLSKSITCYPICRNLIIICAISVANTDAVSAHETFVT
jgi:hypothetical protein